MASKPGSQAKPTIEEVKEWDEDELLGRIQQNQPKLLKGDRAEKFKEAAISGDVFVYHAGDVDFFEKKCKLPIGVSERLANLASELAGRETAGMVQKRKEQDTSAGNREQVESAEPSSKRRRLEGFDAMPLDLTPLADIARGQRDYLHQQYPDQRELCYRLSDPALMTRLPFPFPGKGKPIERFTILDSNYWDYMGREYFTTLLDKITQLMGSAARKLSLYGTIGYGKSHLLAALVCYLTVAGKRVVYIPDCRECCEGPFRYFQAVMLFAWADDEKARDYIMKLKSMEEIEYFFQCQPEILFIVDQTNALDLGDGEGDTVSNDTKKDVRKWIDAFAAAHKVIYSASANYQARVRMDVKQTNDEKIYVYGGFSATEMQQWWIRNNKALPDEYKANDPDKDKAGDPDEEKAGDLETFKSEVEDMTGRIPLLLDKCIVEGKINLSAPKLNRVFSQVQEFMLTIEKVHKDFWELHCEYVTACIINQAPPLELPLRYIDHRYFYVEDGKARYACGIAREAAARRLRQHKMTAFANQDSLDCLVKYIHNPSVTGFFIEQAVLSSIVTRGLVVKGVHPLVRQETFRGAYPKLDKSLVGWVLYCPLQFNYPAIDAILVQFVNPPQKDNPPKEDNSRKKNTSRKNNSNEKDNSGEKKCLMYPIQVTVAKSHADSAEEFFNHRGDWTRGLDDYDIKIEFCWITPDQNLGHKTVPSSSRSLRSGQIVKPCYEITHIPLREVSEEICSKYERAKES